MAAPALSLSLHPSLHQDSCWEALPALAFSFASVVKILCAEYSILGVSFGRIWQRQLPAAAASSGLWGFAAAQGLQISLGLLSLGSSDEEWKYFHCNPFCLPPSPALAVLPLWISRHEHNLSAKAPPKMEGFVRFYLSDPNFIFFPVKSLIMTIHQCIFNGNK